MLHSNQHQEQNRIFTVMHWKHCSAQSGRCSRRLEYSAQNEIALQAAYCISTVTYTSTENTLNTAFEQVSSSSHICFLLWYDRQTQMFTWCMPTPEVQPCIHFVLSGESFVAMRPEMGRL